MGMRSTAHYVGNASSGVLRLPVEVFSGALHLLGLEDYPQARYKKWDADSSSQRIIE
jgi:hypothetical protein